MSKNILLYTISAILVVVLIVIVVTKARNNSRENQQLASHAQVQNQNGQQSSNSQQPAITGCPKGQDVNQTDASGKFIPTLPIANKIVTLNTNFGVIKIQLYDKDAPKTVENFVCLVMQKYYDGVTFHRVAHNFVIQGGDPTGTGAGGTSVYGGQFQDELYPDSPSYQAGYLKGTVAMANAGPNTNTSQFFIMLVDASQLPFTMQKNYTIFGKVISGLDVVEKIGALPIQGGGDDGPPTQKVIINSANVN